MNLFDGGILQQTLGPSLRAGSHDGSSTNVEVNVFGGSIDELFEANGGSTVNFFGGAMQGTLDARSGSTVNFSGGTADRINARSDSTVNLSAGQVGTFVNFAGSSVHVTGDEFLLDGVPVAGLDAFGDTVAFTVPSGSRLRGTLTDGSLVWLGVGDMTLTRAPVPAVVPVINLPADPAPNSLRGGQTLNLAEGGAIGPNVKAFDSFINISGGSVDYAFHVTNSIVDISGGDVGLSRLLYTEDAHGSDMFTSIGADLRFSDSVVNISGGNIGTGFHIPCDHLFSPTTRTVGFVDSVVNVTDGIIGDLASVTRSVITISGGQIGNGLRANNGAIINVSGGKVGQGIIARSGSIINISGGTFEPVNHLPPDTAIFAQSGSTINFSGGIVNGVDASSGSTINISGGLLRHFVARPGSTVNLVGSSFILDGLDLTLGLTPGEVMLITDQDVVLEGLLADGSPFTFNIGTNTSVLPDAIWTVTLVPEPGTWGLICVGALYALRRRRMS